MSKTFPPGTSRKEITEHWEWLEHNLLQTLSIFENENDITTFVKGKVQVSNAKVEVDVCTWTQRKQWGRNGFWPSVRGLFFVHRSI